MLEKKYYDGMQIHDVLCECLDDYDTILTILEKFASLPSATKADRKTEPTCDTCRHKGVEGCEQPCLGCGCCGLYEAMTGNDKLKEKVVEFIKSCARCKHRPIGAMMCEESCHYEPKTETQTETQNSNLTFEKVMEEIQTQVIEFPDTHQKFVFTRKIEMDGDSIKICGWEYKGVADGEREDKDEVYMANGRR